jgi:hypothetical protein
MTLPAVPLPVGGEYTHDLAPLSAAAKRYSFFAFGTSTGTPRPSS